MTLLEVTSGGLERDIIFKVTTLDMRATGKHDINVYLFFLVRAALSHMEAPSLVYSLSLLLYLHTATRLCLEY